MSSIIISALYGVIVGLAWSFALHNNFNGGALYGSIIGGLIGLLFFIMQKGVYSRGRVTKKETYFIAGSMMSVLLVVGLVTAVIAYVVRLVL